MKKLSKKIKLLLFFTILIIILILLFFYLNSKNKGEILFESSYHNNAWGPEEYGYYIYLNGVIEEFDKYDKSKKLKSGKITDEELNQLKELANAIEDQEENQEEKNDKNELNSLIVYDSEPYDIGSYTQSIYNDRLGKWVSLNSSETSQKISELTNYLNDKYLSED